MRRIAAAVVVSVMCAGALAGCSPSGPELPRTTPSPTAESADPEATPSLTVSSAGPRDLSEPELGVVFTDFPRDRGEEVGAAIQTYMQFEIEFWRALTTNVVPPGPWAVASDDSIAWIQAQVGPNSENGWKASGTERVAIDVESATESAVTLKVCTNWTDARFENVDGTVETVGSGLDETSATRIMLSNEFTSGWKVVGHEILDAC